MIKANIALNLEQKIRDNTTNKSIDIIACTRTRKAH